MLTAADRKLQNHQKGDITQHHVAIQGRRCDDGWYHPFNDFCGFWSVAVNTVDKLQFLVLIKRYRPDTQKRAHDWLLYLDRWGSG